MAILSEFPVLDDVGSFPLPSYISQQRFNQYYWDVYEALLKGGDVRQNSGLFTNVIHPIEHTFHLKNQTGMEIINFPQIIDMYSQFLHPMANYEEKNEPNVIQEKYANLIEVNLLKKWAKRQYEENGEQICLKVCVTGT